MFQDANFAEEARHFSRKNRGVSFLWLLRFRKPKTSPLGRTRLLWRRMGCFVNNDE